MDKRVVNTLLAKLDGVEQLNNILIIGMTNFMDSLDPALLRSGRLALKVIIEFFGNHLEFWLQKYFGKILENKNTFNRTFN